MEHLTLQTISEIRKSQYEDKMGRFPFLNDWKRNPYTFLKARFYIETSVFLLYFLLRTNISANMITILYGWAGILGCICLIIPSDNIHILAVLIFFSKGILDWIDGWIARLKGQTSLTGHVLDGYGALLNDLGFQIGLGFYVAFKTDTFIFYYLIPLIPFFYAISLRSYSEKILLTELLKDSFLKREMKNFSDAGITTYDKISDNVKRSVLGKHLVWFNRLNSFLDSRARNVDFICLLILIETFSKLSVVWIIFLLFLIKGFVLFLGSYFVTIRKRVVEKKLDCVLHNIKNLDES